MPAAPEPVEILSREAPKLSGAALVAATWEELQETIRPVGTRVFIRTEKPPEKKGAIWLPPEYWSTFGRKLGGQVPVTGTVLSIGRRVPVDLLSEGERVFFFRLPFGWTHKMTDGTFVGWIDYKEIIGRPVGDDVLPYTQAD